MSKKTDQFESDIVTAINGTNSLPSTIPQWMEDIGIRPGARITDVNRMGGSGSKTDVIIHLDSSNPIKISAKLSSADYFGNWYSHNRVIREFGSPAFTKLVNACTDWANWWKLQPSASLFVGVSVNFGRRSGNTFSRFTDVFNYNDIVKIVAGFGHDNDVANCLYQSSIAPNDINDLLSNLKPIDQETIYELSSNFQVIFRPVNPMTEGTNRGKCIYTQFKPYRRLPEMTTITELSALTHLGEYVHVGANSINHNRLLNELESDYNISIPRKG
ncbi:hypothetical protein GLW20_08565 [Virgibacillus halodenitrificans]|nr:hypothetical protein [Virgibacillus halodenitrificans]